MANIRIVRSGRGEFSPGCDSSSVFRVILDELEVSDDDEEDRNDVAVADNLDNGDEAQPAAECPVRAADALPGGSRRRARGEYYETSSKRVKRSPLTVRKKSQRQWR